MTEQKIIVDMNLALYDGESGVASGNEAGTALSDNAQSTQQQQNSNKEVNSEDLSLARANGIPDRLAKDYAAAKRRMSAQASNTADDANTQQTAAQTDNTENVSARFSDMIRQGGEFHDEYTNRLNENLSRRMKSVNEQNANLSKQIEAYSKIAENVAIKYGIDPNNIEALAQAVQKDDSYLSQLALDNGLTVDEQRKKLGEEKRVKDLEEKVNRYEQRDADFEVRRYLDSEAEKLKAVYPDFDMATELNENPEFSKLLQVTKAVYGKENVQLAYEMANRDRHLQSVVNAMGGKMQEALAKQMASTGRPQSNANITSATSPQPKSINQMSSKEISELAAESKRTGVSVSEILRRRKN